MFSLLGFFSTLVSLDTLVSLFGITKEASSIIYMCSDCKRQLCFGFVGLKGVKCILFICWINLVYLLIDDSLLYVTFYKCKGSWGIERGQQNILRGKTVSHLTEEKKLNDRSTKQGRKLCCMNLNQTCNSLKNR